MFSHAARVAPEERIHRPPADVLSCGGLGEDMARKAIGKRLRFDVFKRDGFRCQYCGAEAPKAVLHVDHINPVAKGGGNDLLNLITSCEDCNSGKSDRTLADDSAVSKQRAQLDELHERREQMEMMLQWREGLNEIKDTQDDVIRARFRELAPGKRISETSKLPKEWLRKYSLNSILDAMELAAEKYIQLDAEGNTTAASAEDMLRKVGGILHLNSLPPEQKRLRYIKGILNNRLSYVPYDAMADLERALADGASLDEMEREAKYTRNWTAFLEWLQGAG